MELDVIPGFPVDFCWLHGGGVGGRHRICMEDSRGERERESNLKQAGVREVRTVISPATAPR